MVKFPLNLTATAEMQDLLKKTHATFTFESPIISYWPPLMASQDISVKLCTQTPDFNISAHNLTLAIRYTS